MSRDLWNRYLKIAVIALFGYLVVAIALYMLFGGQLVRAIYNGESTAILNGLITEQASHPVDYYLQSFSESFWMRIVGFPVTFLFAILVYFTLRYFFVRLPSPAIAPPTEQENVFKYDWLLALAVYSFLTIIYYYPCLSTMNTHIIGPGEDNMSGFWDLWWANDMVLHGNYSLTSGIHVYYPQGTSFYYIAWSFYTLAVLYPLRLFVDAVTGYNLVVMHTFPLAGFGAFLLIRYLTRNSWLALLGGFLYAFSPGHFIRAQHHYHINNIQFVPFFVLYYIRTVKEGTRRNLILATLFFLLNAASDWNYMFFGLYFIAFSYIYLAIRNQRFVMPDLIKKSAVITIIPILLLSFWLIPMAQIGLSNKEVNLPGHRSFVADIVGLYLPNFYHWLGQVSPLDRINNLYQGNPWECISYLGLASVVLVFVGFGKISRLASPYFIAAIAFLIMALGAYPHVLGQPLPIRLPDQVLAQLPFLSNLRAPIRFMSYVYLFWSIIVMFALKSLIASTQSVRGKMLLIAIVPLLLFADYFNICSNKTEVAAPPCYRAIAADSTAFGILNLPTQYVESCRYMMYQASHRIPIVNGATTRKVGVSLIDTLSLTDLSRQQRQLVDSRVKYIVIHKDILGLQSFNWADYRQRYSQFYEDDRSLVLKVY